MRSSVGHLVKLEASCGRARGRCLRCVTSLGGRNCSGTQSAFSHLCLVSSMQFTVNARASTVTILVVVDRQILDFMDTVFIILKKSWRQLSFLHVYHHTTIFLVRCSLDRA